MGRKQVWADRLIRVASIDLSPGPGVSSEAYQYPWYATVEEVDEATDRAIRGVLGKWAPVGDRKRSQDDREEPTALVALRRLEALETLEEAVSEWKKLRHTTRIEWEQTGNWRQAEADAGYAILHVDAALETSLETRPKPAMPAAPGGPWERKL